MRKTSSKKKKTITNEDIQDILALKAELKSYEGKAAVTKEALNQKEQAIHALLIKGADTSDLKYYIAPKVTERRFPKWKDFFIQYNGAKLAEKILNRTTPVSYVSILIRRKVKIVD